MSTISLRLQYVNILIYSLFPVGLTPAVTVGVVGIGHMAGIVEHWEHGDYDIRDLMK